MITNRWSDIDAKKSIDAAGDDPADRQLALRVYSSRLIGQDRDLVMHGGGNTSVKVVRKDIFGNNIRVLHVKGSGWDLSTINAGGLPAVRLDPLRELRVLEQLSDEDMVNIQRCNLLDSTSSTPSVETLLHAFLPHSYVDHTHSTVFMALANLADAEAVMDEIFGGKMAFVPYIMPGFELAKLAADIYDDNPDVEGLLLAKHGHFAFGSDAGESYERLIRHSNMVASWFDVNLAPVTKVAVGPVSLSSGLEDILPVLRGKIGAVTAAYTGRRDGALPVMDLRAGEAVTGFLARSDITALAGRGVATPDHVIRTKKFPLHLTGDILAGGTDAIAVAIDNFVADYKACFDRNNDGMKIMLSPTPNLAWIEAVGIVGIGTDAKAAAIAADLGEQTLKVMAMAETGGGFRPLGEKRLFEMEYWSLEQAKLGRKNPQPLTGRIVLITGGAGAIGLATARAFAAMGANIFLVDHDQQPLERARAELGSGHGAIALDITGKDAAAQAVHECVRRFGGLDIMISNAGAAWSGEIATLDDVVLRRSFELNFFAHQACAAAAVKIFGQQGGGGQILFNVSKQSVNPGSGFGAYGIPKAATFFLLRQLALELGAQGIRVNGINADRIRSGLLDEDFIEERAGARGVSEADYMAGNLLHREVEARHVAAAFVALALSERTTAHVMTVDGGNIAAALR